MRVTEIISEAYQKYLPIVKKLGLTLDIDFPDTTLTIHEHERVRKDLDKTLRSAVKRSTPKNGRISITVRPGEIIITDNGTILSKTTCDLLSSEHVKVTSRVGFGTKAVIK